MVAQMESGLGGTGQHFPLQQPVADGHIDGLVQDCSNSGALAVELLQSCTKLSTCLLPDGTPATSEASDRKQRLVKPFQVFICIISSETKMTMKLLFIML